MAPRVDRAVVSGSRFDAHLPLCCSCFPTFLIPLVDFHLHFLHNFCHLLALLLTEVAGAPGMSTACDVQPIAADLCCSFQSVAWTDWKVSEMHVLKRFGVTIESVFCATTYRGSDKTEQVDGKSNVILHVNMFIQMHTPNIHHC